LGARIEMIERAGHLPQLEQPDAVLKALSGFPRRVKCRAG